MSRATSVIVKCLPALLAMLLALVCGANLLAQTDIRIIPIPQPYTDTGSVLAAPNAAPWPKRRSLWASATQMKQSQTYSKNWQVRFKRREN